ncbi:DUF2326 domain-containing protein [Halomonas sp. HAL1]|uniref:DUF2326 domain-containing protein n=1 Tax=Halomonas sp. HAL1 TaxID=550984 RepID=UPI00022D3153|nr:DUF2326 domain-containing protein [Halomonas sp. HAL1]EHA13625.1 hypothetical protein HAL1_20575 [Halomonas sp. HAL1]WKV91855.1 DUF2326 domain-containing protein [Halomonas sp. HAL1]
MRLNKFVLEVDGEMVREIPFLDGLNIITNLKDSAPGNSVGKSTLGRVLDYLFDGPIAPIYIDEEFGTPNSEIELLLTDKIVYVSLEYKGLKGSLSTIKRRLSTITICQSYYINDVEVDRKDYILHIMKTVFNVFSEKPTIRKLAPKFFRTNQYRMLHTVKFDNGRSVSKSDVSTVFLYLFNFSNTEILSKRHKLKNAVKRYDRQVISFKGVISEQKILSSINNIKKQVEKLENSFFSTDRGIDKFEIVSKINDVDDMQNSLSDKVLELDLKLRNISKTNELLISEDQYYLIEELRAVYGYASAKVDSVLVDYSESLIFHKQLVNAKKEFVSDGLEDIQIKKRRYKEEMNGLKERRNLLYKEMKSKKEVEELSDTVKRIGELNKELLKLNAIVEQKETIEEKYFDESERLENISRQLEKELESVRSFEKVFVDTFKAYTKSFYEVGYNFSLNVDEIKGECSPTVDEVQSNSEGGLKRLEVVLFDLSYIKTVAAEEVYRPNFVLHDSIDDIHINYIKKLFEESCKLAGQHILSMLSDKLPDDQYQKYKKHMILELSQRDKFFKV